MGYTTNIGKCNEQQCCEKFNIPFLFMVEIKTSQYKAIVYFNTEHQQLAKGYIKVPDTKQANNNLCTQSDEDLNPSGQSIGALEERVIILLQMKSLRRKSNRINFLIFLIFNSPGLE